MKKDEAEQAIRSLSTQWIATLPVTEGEHPSFSAFRDWLSVNGWSHYLTFRSVMGPLDDAERWFNQELGQTWRD